MLNFSFTRCKKSPSTMISHVTKPEMSIYINTQNLSAEEDYRVQFRRTMNDFYANHPDGNPDEIEYIHVMLSNEKYDGQTAAEMQSIGLRFAHRIFPDAQYIVATQPHETPASCYRHETEEDDSLHCHIIVCATSLVTGDMVHVDYCDYPDLRKTAEDIAKDYGLESKTKKAEKLTDLRKGHEDILSAPSESLSWMENLKKRISAAVTKASTLDEFYSNLQKDGIRAEPTPSLDDFLYFYPGFILPCRGKALGRLFTRDWIIALIENKNN